MNLELKVFGMKLVYRWYKCTLQKHNIIGIRRRDGKGWYSSVQACERTNKQWAAESEGWPSRKKIENGRKLGLTMVSFTFNLSHWWFRSWIWGKIWATRYWYWNYAITEIPLYVIHGACTRLRDTGTLFSWCVRLCAIYYTRVEIYTWLLASNCLFIRKRQCSWFSVHKTDK